MAKSNVGEVWGLRHGKLHCFTNVRIGEMMITLPDGQRRAKNGRGTDGFYASELEAALAIIDSARWKLQYHRENVAGYESIVEDCERVLGLSIPEQAGPTDTDIDKHLDAVLRAAGSALRHYSLPGTLKAMREAMGAAMAGPAPRTWAPITTAPKDGSEIWAFNGEQGVMKWIEGKGYGLWAWADDTLADVDPSPAQPTHWREKPEPPSDGLLSREFY